MIVRFRGSPDTRLITGTGGVSRRRLAAGGSQVAEIDNRLLADLANHPQIARVSIAHLIGLKVIDAQGNGYMSNVIAAIDHAIAVKDVWSTGGDDNIVWSTGGGDNIAWSTASVDQTLWPVALSVDNRRRALPGRNWRRNHENPSHDHLAAIVREAG